FGELVRECVLLINGVTENYEVVFRRLVMSLAGRIMGHQSQVLRKRAARLSRDAEGVSRLTGLAQPLHLFAAELEPATTATAAALAAAGAAHWPEDRHLLEDLLERALVGRGFGRLVGPFLVRRVRVSHPVLPVQWPCAALKGTDQRARCQRIPSTPGECPTICWCDAIGRASVPSSLDWSSVGLG